MTKIILIQSFLLQTCSMYLKVFLFAIFVSSVATSSDMLIIGASVSNNYAAPSPGDIIAKANNIAPDRIVKMARNGATSKMHDDYIRNKLTPFDYIVALDLFYHDFKQSFVLKDRDFKHVGEYIEKLAQHGKVVLLGTTLNIAGLRGTEIARKRIIKLAKKYDNVHVLDVDSLYKKLEKGLKYNVNGVKKIFTKSELMSDEIHPNEKGNIVMANLFIKLLKDKKIKGNLSYIPLQ